MEVSKLNKSDFMRVFLKDIPLLSRYNEPASCLEKAQSSPALGQPSLYASSLLCCRRHVYLCAAG